jgi:hypothetical protein
MNIKQEAARIFTEHTGVEVIGKPAYFTVTSNCLRQAVENGAAASMAYDINKQMGELSTRVAELESDAARYRFIRSKMDDDIDYELFENKGGRAYGMKQGIRLDNAIDKALAGTK